MCVTRRRLSVLCFSLVYPFICFYATFCSRVFFCLVFYFTRDDVVSQRLGFGRWNFFIGVTYGHVLF